MEEWPPWLMGAILSLRWHCFKEDRMSRTIPRAYVTAVWDKNPVVAKEEVGKQRNKSSVQVGK